MMIIGVDYRPNFQTIAFLVEENGFIRCGHVASGRALRAATQ